MTNRKWYVEQYGIGYMIVRGIGASLQRWPISHGPFDTEDEAVKWAEENLQDEPV
jgi:hypothetical protein